MVRKLGPAKLPWASWRRGDTHGAFRPWARAARRSRFAPQAAQQGAELRPALGAACPAEGSSPQPSARESITPPSAGGVSRTPAGCCCSCGAEGVRNAVRVARQVGQAEHTLRKRRMAAQKTC